MLVWTPDLAQGRREGWVTKDEEGCAVTVPTESSIGFPSTLLFACYHCLLILSETCCVFHHIVYELYKYWCLQVHPRMSFVEWGKKMRSSWREKTYMEDQKQWNCCIKEYVLSELHCVLSTCLKLHCCQITGWWWLWGFSMLWYSWDSSLSFRFGWNLPLDSKFGVLQVCWKNHEHKGRNVTYIRAHTEDDGLFFLR